MNARIPCLASQDADAQAHQQGEYDAEDAALDAKVKAEYIDLDARTGFAADFLCDVVPNMPLTVAQELEAASKGYGGFNKSSTGPDMHACARVGIILLEWLCKQARERARRDMQEARNA
ncbi:hypothetical protein [Delftia acidovorans]|uniref:hypothetical protein n=1 Tax=Delftia acidovorans TaxID=80866 RepID=UPI002FDCA345